MSKKYKGPRPLIVEGTNDCHVIWALCTHYDVPENFGLFDSGSDVDAVKKFTASLAAPENHEVVGIVLDADTDVSARWRSIENRLKKEGYQNLPASPKEGGTIIDGQAGKPRIGLWIMPNNLSEGMLEDFCQSMVENTDAIDYARSCVESAKEQGFSSYKDPHISKAVLHTYLSWQDEPGKPLGAAITAKLLSPDTELANNFSQFLIDLYQ